MMRFRIVLLLVFIVSLSDAQSTLPEKLQSALNRFNADAQVKYGITGFCLLDGKTGNVLYENNANIGLAPASTQKIVTAITALTTLGPDYRFKTEIGYTGKKTGNMVDGDLVITASGDPTLASFRFKTTSADLVLANIVGAIKAAGIDSINGNIVCTSNGFDLNPMPSGYTWGDMGNYYGSGHWALNWNENQYDLKINTGSTGAPVTITGSSPNPNPAPPVANMVVAGTKGTNDNSLIFAAPFSSKTIFQGDLEPNRSNFTVSGAMPNADSYALNTIKSYLKTNGIAISGRAITPIDAYLEKRAAPSNVTGIYTISSPSLDSIIYWFLRKSVNLYGEALLKTVALEKTGTGSTTKGLDYVETFFKSNGFDSDAMHLYDGSGLSPANRVTPSLLAKALFMAQDKDWFKYFYEGLPTYNGMKLKSGTIGRVKCFAGYHTAKTGEDYIVVFMVNNYNHSPSAIVSKMYTVLDLLK